MIWFKINGHELQKCKSHAIQSRNQKQSLGVQYNKALRVYNIILVCILYQSKPSMIEQSGVHGSFKAFIVTVVFDRESEDTENV